MPAAYRVGFQPKVATDTYHQAFVGPATAFNPKAVADQRRLDTAPDTTILVAEVGPAVPWTKPGDVAVEPGKPFPAVKWPFANVANVALVSGVCLAIDPAVGDDRLRKLVEFAGSKPEGVNGLALPDPDGDPVRVTFNTKGMLEGLLKRNEAAKTLKEAEALNTAVRKLVDELRAAAEADKKK
jgi:hypothetical protein